MLALKAALDRDDDLRDLLSHEGQAAQLYWETLVGTLLPWPDFASSKIPAHWRMVGPRVSGGRNRVRDARDPFNALLNYGYTLLEVETRIACAAEGLDPDLGYLHVDERLRESFVYDLLEPLRVEVDRLTLEWCHTVGERRSRSLRPWMFIELRDGVVRLDPDAARNYAHAVMPRLRTPALHAASEFATQLRRITIPYRLIDDRKAVKRRQTSAQAPCGYCGQPVGKVGLKFCGRPCYLRHSSEVRKPIELARAKLATMREEGCKPGWDAEAREKREAGKAEVLRKRVPGITPEQTRARKAEQQRGYYRKKRAQISDAPALLSAKSNTKATD
jgi:hypothetical protein